MWDSAAFEEGGAPACSNSDGEGDQWGATIGPLKVNSAYSIRIRSKNIIGPGEWADLRVTTLGRLPRPSEFQWTHAGSGKIQMSWRIEEPPEAVVRSCKVQVLNRPLIGSPYWEEPSFEPGTKPRRTEEDRWVVTVLGIAPETDVSIGICGINEVGEGPTVRQELRTLNKPAMPESLLCIQAQSDKLVLEWQVPEEPGAEMLDCEVQLGGVWSQPATFDVSGQPRRLQGTLWHAEVCGLAPDTSHKICVRGRNALGEGPWAQQPFRTTAASSVS